MAMSLLNRATKMLLLEKRMVSSYFFQIKTGELRGITAVYKSENKKVSPSCRSVDCLSDYLLDLSQILQRISRNFVLQGELQAK